MLLQALLRFGEAKPVVYERQATRRSPGTGTWPIGGVTVGRLDPFPDELLPPLWTAEAREILNSAPTGAQENAPSADDACFTPFFLLFSAGAGSEPR